VAGLPVDVFSLFGLVDAVLFISISYLYLHQGKPERDMTEKEMRKRAWIIIAFAVLLIASTIAVLLLLAR
jgi:predicted CDP-diglyceride synthetase/phosphatidate cytidylyltransferase